MRAGAIASNDGAESKLNAHRPTPGFSDSLPLVSNFPRLYRSAATNSWYSREAIGRLGLIVPVVRRAVLANVRERKRERKREEKLVHQARDYESITMLLTDFRVSLRFVSEAAVQFPATDNGVVKRRKREREIYFSIALSWDYMKFCTVKYENEVELK